MTTLYRQEVACRICGQASEQTVMGSTNTLGGSPDLDLRPPEMMRSTIHAWTQRCPHCGFCGPEIATADGDEAIVRSPEYRAILDDPQYPELARQFLARGLLLKDSDPEEAAQSNLHAAWICDDEGRDELATKCRLEAAASLERLKPFDDTEPGLTRAALLVDLLRRAGRFKQAASECESLLDHPRVSGILKQVLEFQSRLITAGDRESHRVQEAEHP